VIRPSTATATETAFAKLTATPEFLDLIAREYFSIFSVVFATLCDVLRHSRIDVTQRSCLQFSYTPCVAYGYSLLVTENCLTLSTGATIDTREAGANIATTILRLLIR